VVGEHLCWGMGRHRSPWGPDWPIWAC